MVPLVILLNKIIPRTVGKLPVGPGDYFFIGFYAAQSKRVMDPSSLRLTKLGTNRLTRDQSLILLVLKSYPGSRTLYFIFVGSCDFEFFTIFTSWLVSNWSTTISDAASSNWSVRFSAWRSGLDLPIKLIFLFSKSINRS